MSDTYFTPGSIKWMLGIEDTCVYPPPGSTMGELDEHRLTGHDDRWREDFDSIVALGATGVRYGVSWPLVHVAPDSFDWSMLDERFEYAVNTLGLTVIADLVHYGTPTWLTGSFGDIRYPDAVAQFAGRFADRYRGVVDHITPLNEPITTASFCGLRGVWPPALTGWSGWTTVTIAIVDGMRRSIAAIRRANPDAVIVHVEASSLFETDDADLRAEVDFLEAIAMLPTELLLGRVSTDHPQFAFLVANGAEPVVLASFTQSAPEIDVLGVNYYPDLTPRHLRSADGVVTQATQNKGAEGLRMVLQKASDRFGIPLAVTETSIEGSEQVRREWLEAATALVATMREEGLDIRGFTWWPLLDFVDWSYASGGRNVEEFVLDPRRGIAAEQEWFAEDLDDLPSFFRRMGLLEVTDDALARRATDAATSFVTLTRASQSIGDDLATQH